MFFFYFLQCALSDFFIFASKFVLYLLTQFKMFSSSVSTYHRNRCTYKNNINLKFIFTVRSVRFLHLYFFYFFFTYKHSLNFFPYSKGTFQRNRCAFKNNLKPHILFFYSVPCQISLSLHQNFCFTN